MVQLLFLSTALKPLLLLRTEMRNFSLNSSRNFSLTLRGILFSSFLLFSILMRAQCVSNFTYAVGNNGQVFFGSTSTTTVAASGYTWNFGANYISQVYSPTANVTYTS